MEKFEYVDLFASKGATYLTVIFFLITFVFFLRYINGKPLLKTAPAIVEDLKLTLVSWFQLARDYFYHQGHAWAAVESNNKIKIGLDDFASKLIGVPSSVVPIKVGQRLQQGRSTIDLMVNGKKLSVLAPVSGRVIEINEKVLANPELVTTSPYTDGWLLKMDAENFAKDATNLLRGSVAMAWLKETVRSINQKMTGTPDLVLQDGGKIIPGFAREIDSENWDKLVKEYLLTE